MKSPIEILKYKQCLERLLLATEAKLDPKEIHPQEAVVKHIETLKVKIMTLDWVLSEKP